jgi:hypothetical protein
VDVRGLGRCVTCHYETKAALLAAGAEDDDERCRNGEDGMKTTWINRAAGAGPTQIGLPSEGFERFDAQHGGGMVEASATARTWPERIAHYARETGFPPAFCVEEGGRTSGLWILGNDYRVQSKYYGGYPATYLRRVKALFPEKQRALHVFSGCTDTTIFPGDTVDINASLNPTYVDDAQTLQHVPLEQYDLVLCDPPYSVEDAERYQTTMIKRNTVMQTLGRRLTSGTHVAWLDQVLPMYRKDDFDVEAYISIVRSTNHRFRVLTIFRKR